MTPKPKKYIVKFKTGRKWEFYYGSDDLDYAKINCETVAKSRKTVARVLERGKKKPVFEVGME